MCMCCTSIYKLHIYLCSCTCLYVCASCIIRHVSFIINYIHGKRYMMYACAHTHARARARTHTHTHTYTHTHTHTRTTRTRTHTRTHTHTHVHANRRGRSSSGPSARGNRPFLPPKVSPLFLCMRAACNRHPLATLTSLTPLTSSTPITCLTSFTSLAPLTSRKPYSSPQAKA